MSTNEVEQDESIGTAVFLPEEEASLSKQIIADYFTSDGPRARRFGATENAPERNILDESSGDDDVHQPRIEPEGGIMRRRSRVEEVAMKLKITLEEMQVWELVVSAMVVLLAIVHCLWLWSLLELSVLSLQI